MNLLPATDWNGHYWHQPYPNGYTSVFQSGERQGRPVRVLSGPDKPNLIQEWHWLRDEVLYDVRMRIGRGGYNGAFDATPIAEDMPRKDAVSLIGLLLMSPKYAAAELVAKPRPGEWRDVKD